MVSTLLRLAVLLAAPLALEALRSLDLTSADGTYAFAGGRDEAQCRACKAVMAHIERQLSLPLYEEQSHLGGRKRTGEEGSRAAQAARLNRASKVEAILDPSKCLTEMRQYDLASVGGEVLFRYRPKGEAAFYATHNELNDWAKQQLGFFCESLLEEREDELSAFVMEAMEAEVVAADAMCEEPRLDLCRDATPPTPNAEAQSAKQPKKKKKAVSAATQSDAGKEQQQAASAFVSDFVHVALPILDLSAWGEVASAWGPTLLSCLGMIVAMYVTINVGGVMLIHVWKVW